MGLKHEIKDFRDEGGKKYVGFKITNEKGNMFVIDKQVSLSEGKTDEQYTQEALALAQDEIDAWAESSDKVGKNWNPDTNSFE
tara:strand:- start:51 stop:299 length:249 start_codon:yes stop_codon:yes gene_type:complete